MEDYYKEVEIRMLALENDKKQWKKSLKGLVNVSGLFNYLNEMDDWYPIGFVEVYEVDEKSHGYKSYQHVRIRDDKYRTLYLKQVHTDIRGIDHTCVWQRVGFMGDDYSGYLLFPLKNGLYFKVEYSY